MLSTAPPGLATTARGVLARLFMTVADRKIIARSGAPAVSSSASS